MRKAATNLPSEIERRDFIKDAFERAGRLDSTQLVEKLNGHFDYDFKESKRTVYRDLEELTNKGFLRECIEEDTLTDVTGEMPRGKAKVWVLAKLSDRFIPGVKLLEQIGGDLLVANILQGSVSINEALRRSNKHYHIVFALGDRVINLEIEKDLIPVRIFICRKTDVEPAKILSALETYSAFRANKSSRRNIMIRLPLSTLSSFKEKTRIAHFGVEFTEHGIELADFNSKNGTFFKSFDPSLLDKILKSPGLIRGKTATTNWTLKELETADLSTVISGASLPVNLPLLVQASRDFKMVIF